MLWYTADCWLGEHSNAFRPTFDKRATFHSFCIFAIIFCLRIQYRFVYSRLLRLDLIPDIVAVWVLI